MNTSVAIIGTGKMGSAIAQRLLDLHVVTAETLFLTDSNAQSLEIFKNQGVHVGVDNLVAISSASVVILAIKPQQMKEVLEEIAQHCSNKLILSIAAGVSILSIENILGSDKKIVRIMPNLCAQVGESMSAWVINQQVTNEDKSLIKKLLQAIGKEVELTEEALIDSVTAISGSGPAYVFYLVELLEKAAEILGINAQDARLLAHQTIIGSAKFLVASDKSAEELRIAVTSKGGTTEAAFTVFAQENVEEKFIKGIQAAEKRSKELSKLA